MKTLILLILTLTLIACDQPYEEGEEVEFDTESNPTDPNCIEFEACTVVYEPECFTLKGSGNKQFLRNYKGCICADGIEYDYYEDQICLEGCVENPIGANYCKEDEGLFL